MFKRSWGRSFLALAFGVGALSATAAQAPAATAKPLPAGVTACKFDALGNDPDPAGLAIRSAPRDDARLLGRLPAIEDRDRGFTAPNKELAQFAVIGVKNGWFLIEGAHYPASSEPVLYTGRGWVDGRLITTHLYRDTLKREPSNAVDDVVYLHGADRSGIAYSPYDAPVSRIVGCSGRWLEVELWVPDGKTLAGKPASADGTVRGWTDRACAQQDKPCAQRQFDYSWSPLPDGVTECNVDALSNDPDPAGLELRAAPDGNARIVGHAQPPSDLGGDTKVAADVHVIGYEKGWFLVELGPYDRADLPPHGPEPYTGRGWVAGPMLTAELLRNLLKQRPSKTSADVINLQVDDDSGNVSNPQAVTMHRLLACSGDWVKVEIALQKGMKPLRASGAPAGAVRGWSNGTCTSQLTTCDFDQSRPWSPPAPLPPE